MYKLNFYVPETHLDSVKSGIFEAGAGRIGNYDRCCWETLGVGQFRALEGSTPYIGELNKVERVKEYKVECVVDDEVIEAVILALKVSHPYEEPAYEVLRLECIPV